MAKKSAKFLEVILETFVMKILLVESFYKFKVGASQGKPGNKGKLRECWWTGTNKERSGNLKKKIGNIN